MKADKGHREIVKILLDAGANPQQDNYFTLKLSLQKNYMEIVELLLEAIFEKRTNS